MERKQLDLFGSAGVPVAPPKKKTKTQQVLEHLQQYGKITSWDAIRLYRATRLAAIIHNLRKRYDIQTIDRKTKEGTPYAEYHLIWHAENQLGQNLTSDPQESRGTDF